MNETMVEYGIPPRDEIDRVKVEKIFEGTWKKLVGIPPGNQERFRKKVAKLIQKVMDALEELRIELPCQGVEYKGVVVGRDSEIPKETPLAPFVQWGESLGVPSELLKLPEKR